MATDFSENSEDHKNFYFCNFCDYKCSKKQHLKQHFFSQKHKNRIFNNVENSVNIGNDTINKYFPCTCGKTYSDRSGLWKHKKKCKNYDDNLDDDDEKTTLTQIVNGITPELVMKLIDQNKELQQTLIQQNKTIMELSKNGRNNYSNNNNSNNNTFNLQFFLNETCKDAINLSEFVNQIQISLIDLEETGRLGYAEGISQVFIKNLNEIDYNKRPIHCSDLKRETLYIKEANKWEKDNDDKFLLTNAIKSVAHKNIKQISEWQKTNPKFSDPASKQNDKYQKIVSNSMSGSTKEESTKNYEKIIKNIAKEVIIQK